ncbi:hypothetical protein [Lysobacter niastensis]|uniref:Uncharacterized protein n=1 Tax=Lysobacter niastensis TaxID=380629 RepID=A0ABS0B823_9GAMM|nr:hypothetical protein [Lysobacter niastensis]MBF6025058.1 hypothetical protein [Lysobacter niastensis]
MHIATSLYIVGLLVGFWIFAKLSKRTLTPGAMLATYLLFPMAALGPAILVRWNISEGTAVDGAFSLIYFVAFMSWLFVLGYRQEKRRK